MSRTGHFFPYIFEGTNDESPKERAARFLPSWGSVYESCGDRWQRNPRGVNEGWHLENHRTKLGGGLFIFHFTYGMSSQPHWRSPSFFKMVKLHHQAVNGGSFHGHVWLPEGSRETCHLFQKHRSCFHCPGTWSEESHIACIHFP